MITSFIVSFIVDQLKDQSIEVITEHVKDKLTDADQHVLMFDHCNSTTIASINRCGITDFTVDVDPLQSILSFNAGEEQFNCFIDDLNAHNISYTIIN